MRETPLLSVLGPPYLKRHLEIGSEAKLFFNEAAVFAWREHSGVISGAKFTL